jgi:hypothetical protein
LLFEPERHEPLAAIGWDESRARLMIEQIVRDTERHFSRDSLWPTHPRDAQESREGTTQCMLYRGACGVFWALCYLEAMGATHLSHNYAPFIEPLLAPNRVAMEQAEGTQFGSYLMGDTGILLLSYWHDPSESTAARLAELIAATIDHPARELMWGAPGTLLAALFLQQHTGAARWAELYRATARRLWSQLEWSAEFQCHYWTQHMYGARFTFLDAVHGFVGTAAPLVQGRHLLAADEWAGWAERIGKTIRRTAELHGPLANWRAHLVTVPYRVNPKLVQFCHGAPGFVICLADFPDSSLDDLLIAAGEMTWQAGPLRKGTNLCHGTGGNGYAFLKLYQRFNDPKWLDHARAFAMHGITQTEAALAKYGQMHYSLWTGDLGFAIYLWDCIRATARFPTLDVFFAR